MGREAKIPVTDRLKGECSGIFSRNISGGDTAPVCDGIYYMYLKDRTGRKGTCWPAIGTIARDLGLSRSTVKRALKDLEEKGYLKREIRHRENGGFTSNRYTIL